MQNLQSPFYLPLINECEMICKQEGLASSTVYNKISALRTIFMEIPELTHSKFLDWLNSYSSKRTTKPLGPHGKNRYIRALNWYLKRSQIIPNAKKLAESLDLRCFSLPSSPGKVILNDEFEEIVQFSPDATHELVFRLMYESAFRPHELLSLRACDIGEKIVNEEFLEIMANGDSNIHSVVIVRIPRENPVTPSGRNKT